MQNQVGRSIQTTQCKQNTRQWLYEKSSDMCNELVICIYLSFGYEGNRPLKVKLDPFQVVSFEHTPVCGKSAVWMPKWHLNINKYIHYYFWYQTNDILGSGASVSLFLATSLNSYFQKGAKKGQFLPMVSSKLNGGLFDTKYLMCAELGHLSGCNHTFAKMIVPWRWQVTMMSAMGAFLYQSRM